MHVDYITKQTCDYATSLPCDNSPRNIIEHDADDQEFYILCPEP